MLNYFSLIQYIFSFRHADGSRGGRNMSNSGEDYCRRDRLSYRQNHQIPGAASATDRYNLPSYDVPGVRHLPLTDSRRLLSLPPSPPTPQSSYDASDNQERRLLSASYDATDNYHSHVSYDLPDHRLPPLPPSPSHYVLDSEEPFIPPPDCYLSPPAPAPPDRFQTTLSAHDHFHLTTGDPYLPSASSSIDKYKSLNSERIYDRYVTDKYGSPASLDCPLDRYSDRYMSSYSGGPGDPYMRQDLGYHNQYRLLNSSYYYQKPNYSTQRFIPASVRPPLYNQYQTLRMQKCCNASYHSRDGFQSRDISPGAQNRIRTGRTSSPVSLVQSATATTIPIDFAGLSSTRERYMSSSFSSTLPRCNSYGDVQSNSSAIGTFRRTANGHENCCYKRRTSSPSSSCSYPPQSLSYPITTSTASSSSSVSSLSSQSFHQPSLPQLSTTW